MLHGSGSNASTWDRFAARVSAEGYRAIAVDLRGHGSSSRSGDYSLGAVRDDVLGLLDTLMLRDAVLVGHSVGAYAALAASLEAPERIDRLVLEDLAAPPRGTRPVNYRAGVVESAPEMPSTRETVAAAQDALAEPAVRGGFAVKPGQVLAAVAGILTMRRDYDLRALASLLRQLSRTDSAWWERLGEVRHPTLVLSGGRDQLHPAAASGRGDRADRGRPPVHDLGRSPRAQPGPREVHRRGAGLPQRAGPQ